MKRYIAILEEKVFNSSPVPTFYFLFAPDHHEARRLLDNEPALKGREYTIRRIVLVPEINTTEEGGNDAERALNGIFASARDKGSFWVAMGTILRACY